MKLCSKSMKVQRGLKKRPSKPRREPVKGGSFVTTHDENEKLVKKNQTLEDNYKE